MDERRKEAWVDGFMGGCAYAKHAPCHNEGNLNQKPWDSERQFREQRGRLFVRGLDVQILTPRHPRAWVRKDLGFRVLGSEGVRKGLPAFLLGLDFSCIYPVTSFRLPNRSRGLGLPGLLSCC